MSGVVKAIFGGGEPKMPEVDPGPTAAELEAQDRAREREAAERADQKRLRAAEQNRARRGRASTIATGGQGLLTSPTTAAPKLKNKLGE